MLILLLLLLLSLLSLLLSLSLPVQGSSGIKQIVNQVVSEAFQTKAMKEKENTSIVIYSMKEKKNDLSDVKDDCV